MTILTMEALHLVITVTVTQKVIALIKGKASWDTYGHLKPSPVLFEILV